jgi:hypothetical protein
MRSNREKLKTSWRHWREFLGVAPMAMWALVLLIFNKVLFVVLIVAGATAYPERNTIAAVWAYMGTWEGVTLAFAVFVTFIAYSIAYLTASLDK